MIRRAVLDDLNQINAIYNYYVETTDISFDLVPRRDDAARDWFNSHDDRTPILVEWEDGMVVGWSCLSLWGAKEGYCYTAELTLYVENHQRGKGIGKRLFHAIIDQAKKLGYHCLISRITAGNDVSVHLHETAGFRYIGTIKEVGRKFDRWLDVLMYQTIL